MEASRAEPLDDTAATLDSLILLMQERGLSDTAQFLAMAKTQFLIESNGVTDEEFRALCDLLDGRQAPRNATAARTRRDSDLRVMRRAWQCPQDAPAGRGRRREVAGQS